MGFGSLGFPGGFVDLVFCDCLRFGCGVSAFGYFGFGGLWVWWVVARSLADLGFLGLCLVWMWCLSICWFGLVLVQHSISVLLVCGLRVECGFGCVYDACILVLCFEGGWLWVWVAGCGFGLFWVL